MKIGFGKKISIACLVVIAPFVVYAQNESTTPLEIDLEKAITIALSESPSIRIADLEIEKKKYSKKSAQSSLYPQIDLVGQYSRAVKKQVMYMDGAFDIGAMLKPAFDGVVGVTDLTLAESFPGQYELGTLKNNYDEFSNAATTSGETEEASAESDGGIEVGRSNTWTGGLNLNWPVVVPTLWKSLDISSLDVELAVEAARSSKINMINSIRKSYYSVLLSKDALNVLQQSYDNAEMSYNDVKNKFNQGIVSEFDLIRAEVNMKNIKPNLIQAQNSYNLMILQLKALMGIDIDQEIIVEGSLLDYEEDLYEGYPEEEYPEEELAEDASLAEE